VDPNGLDLHHHPAEPPRLIVCLGAATTTAIETELRVAARLVSEESRGARPTSATTPMAVTDDEDHRRALDRLLEGDLVVARCEDRLVAVRLFDEGRRLVGAEWYDEPHPPPTQGLDDTQLQLLLALSRGCTIVEAAAAAHLSERTAARRLAAARATLGYRSNVEAALAVRRRVERFRPPR
jgi:hypothetical protein